MDKTFFIQIIQTIGALISLSLCFVFKLSGEEKLCNISLCIAMIFYIGVPLLYIIYDRFIKKGKHER